MNLKKEIKSLKGQPLKKAIFVSEELEALPKINGKPDLSSIENETVGNVIINCLSFCQAKTVKEGFYINTIANLILTSEEETLELKIKFREFLVNVLEKSILQKNDEQESGEAKMKGIYASWIISQVVSELGATLNDNDEIIY